MFYGRVEGGGEVIKCKWEVGGGGRKRKYEEKFLLFVFTAVVEI